MELELAKGVKNNKKNSCRYVSTKQKFKEDVDPLLHGTGSLVMNDTKKAEVLFYLPWSSWERSDTQVSMPRSDSKVNSKSLTVEEDWVKVCLYQPDTYTRTSSDGMHLSWCTAELVYHIWKVIEDLSDWKRANIPICKKEILRNQWDQSSLTSVSGEVMEQVFVEVVSRHMKDKKVAGKTQLIFTKCKLCLTNLIAFCGKTTCSVDERTVTDAIYLDCGRACCPLAFL